MKPARCGGGSGSAGLALAVVLCTARCNFFQMQNRDGGTARLVEADAPPPTAVGLSCADDTECQAALGPMASCLMGSADSNDVTLYYPDGYCSVLCSAFPDSCPPGSVCIVPQGAPYGNCAQI